MSILELINKNQVKNNDICVIKQEEKDIKKKEFIVILTEKLLENNAVIKNEYLYIRLPMTIYEINIEQMLQFTEADFGTLLWVMESTENPQTLLTTYSRIVGYYSAEKNWNQSKLGELKDRRKGNYNFADIPQVRSVD